MGGKRKKQLKLVKLQLVLSVFCMFLAVFGTWFIMERVILDKDNVNSIDYIEYNGVMGLQNQAVYHVTDLWAEYEEVNFERYLQSIGMSEEEYSFLDEKDRDEISEGYYSQSDSFHNVLLDVNEISFISSLAKLMIFSLGVVFFMISLLFSLQGYIKYEEVK